MLNFWPEFLDSRRRRRWSWWRLRRRWRGGLDGYVAEE